MVMLVDTTTAGVEFTPTKTEFIYSVRGNATLQRANAAGQPFVDAGEIPNGPQFPPAGHVQNVVGAVWRFVKMSAGTHIRVDE